MLKAAAGWTGYGCYFTTDDALQWRLPLALQAIAPILLLSGRPWLPESPRWLVNKGRDAEGVFCKYFNFMPKLT